MVGGFVFYLFDIFCLILFNIFQYGCSLPGGGLALATEGLTEARQVKTASSVIREGDNIIVDFFKCPVLHLVD